MIHIRNLIPLIIIVFLIACSKEKRIENSISKRDGVWNISSVEYSRIEQIVTGSNYGQSVTIEKTESNIGTFSFDKEFHDIMYDYTLNGEHRKGGYDFTIDDENIIITSANIGISGFIYYLTSDAYYIEQIAVNYIGEKTDKNSLVIEGSEIYQHVSDTSTVQISLTATFYLTR
ncbi:MAG: hypothetical protein ABIJ97_12275 [Bacteroidota bacterium]